MTWGMQYMNTLVPSVKVQTGPSLARQRLVPTTALLAMRPDRQFVVRDGERKKKKEKDHYLHANLAGITSLRQEKWN